MRMLQVCHSHAARFTIRSRLVQACSSLALVAMLAACSGQSPQISQSDEAARYAAHARGNYVPPGPPQDPWRPYIQEASKRFDVPDRWIREVMRVESGGKLYHNGQLVTSGVGAMGLMQVMPETYDELRERYDLGEDAYDPHNNILAGTAYIREMYDIYGAPGFLAAYNAGPKRLDDYLSNTRPLPDETRRYVSMIGPYILDSHPANRSPAEQYAMNELPTDIPPGTRYGGRSYQVAQARTSSGGGNGNTRTVRATTKAERQREYAAAKQRQYADARSAPVQASMADYTVPASGGRRGFHIIPAAVAEPIPVHRGGPINGNWAIQVGAFGNAGQAQAATGEARQKAGDSLSSARPAVASVKQKGGVLWRARLTGLSRNSAVEACEKLGRSRTSCIVLSPDSQS